MYLSAGGIAGASGATGADFWLYQLALFVGGVVRDGTNITIW